jgi:hypothetical protein
MDKEEFQKDMDTINNLMKKHKLVSISVYPDGSIAKENENGEVQRLDDI